MPGSGSRGGEFEKTRGRRHGSRPSGPRGPYSTFSRAYFQRSRDIPTAFQNNLVYLHFTRSKSRPLKEKTGPLKFGRRRFLAPARDTDMETTHHGREALTGHSLPRLVSSRTCRGVMATPLTRNCPIAAAQEVCRRSKPFSRWRLLNTVCPSHLA